VSRVLHPARHVTGHFGDEFLKKTKPCLAVVVNCLGGIWSVW